jgi:hypothetical protein
MTLRGPDAWGHDGLILLVQIERAAEGLRIAEEGRRENPQLVSLRIGEIDRSDPHQLGRKPRGGWTKPPWAL